MKVFAPCAVGLVAACALFAPPAAAADPAPSQSPEPTPAYRLEPGEYDFKTGVNVALNVPQVAARPSLLDVAPPAYRHHGGRRGSGLMVAGIILTGVGIVLFATGLVVTTSGDRADNNADIGVPLMLVGGVSMAIGIPMWVVGSRRHYAATIPATQLALRDTPKRAETAPTQWGLAF